MPYRMLDDPKRRARKAKSRAWQREYRRRQRAGVMKVTAAISDARRAHAAAEIKLAVRAMGRHARDGAVREVRLESRSARFAFLTLLKKAFCYQRHLPCHTMR